MFPSQGSLFGLVHQDTCCQFVSVVWLQDGLRPDPTSMLRRTRRRNMPIRLFVLPSFHPATIQWDVSQLEVKPWRAGKEALNHSSSPKHQHSTARLVPRPCKSLNSFSPRGKWGTKHGSKDHLGSSWLKFDPKVSRLQMFLT